MAKKFRQTSDAVEEAGRGSDKRGDRAQDLRLEECGRPHSNAACQPRRYNRIGYLPPRGCGLRRPLPDNASQDRRRAKPESRDPVRSDSALCIGPPVAADFASSMVHSSIHSIACLIASARRLPVVAPLTMLTVKPSIPANAPRAAFAAACSMLDRPVWMLLIEALALLTVHLDNKFELVVRGHFASE
jgi:hypothetical protein